MSSSGISAFGELCGYLEYPMVVATVPGSGCLVGFTTQCSLDPVRYLVCISKANHTHHHSLRATTMAVHVLDTSDRGLAELFGEVTGDEVDKLSLVPWSPGPDGVPILEGAAAWFAGRVVDRVDLGDHTGHVLDVVDAEVRRWSRQLGFQAVKGMPPGHRP